MVALWQWLKQDWRGLRRSMDAWQPPQPGLYTYRIEGPHGNRRVHLRVEADLSGVLFVDVTDVIHLNSTATELAQWALEGVALDEAWQRLRVRHGRRSQGQWQHDLHASYEMIERLATPSLGCPTCALADLQSRPLFSTQIHAPYKADLALTYECNNDCPHCYNESDRLSLDMLPASTWHQIIDRLVDVGVPHLILTGGEATLHPELLAIIRHANQRGPICGLNTNGRRLAQPGYARQLFEAGLNHVQITLGSHQANVHDRMMNAHCFDQTVRGIREAVDSGLHTITNTTLMKMNRDNVEETIDFLHQLGIRTFAMNGMIYSGGGFDTGEAIREEEMPSLLVRIRDHAQDLGMRFLWYTPTQYCRLSPVELEIGAKRCNAGEYSLCIEPNGDVLPCQSYYVAAGNILKDPWEEIWSSQLFVSFRDRELAPEQYGLPEMCWECPDLPLCGGGCRIEREAQDGVRSSDGGCSGCGTGGCSSGGCGTSSAPGLHLIDLPAMPAESADRGSRRRGTGQFRDLQGSRSESTDGRVPRSPNQPRA